MDTNKSDTKEKCFVIMPISDPSNYEKGHFRKIYEQIFIPAIEKAGFYPHRVDEDMSSHFIQMSIIKELIEAPLVLCDLSTRNPNVLYELGIRHAFNKPVVLVQESDTERVFDISVFNTVDYRSSRFFDEVVEDQDKIAEAITATYNNEPNYSMTQIVDVVSAQASRVEISREDRTAILLSSMQNELYAISAHLNSLESRNNSNADYVVSQVTTCRGYIQENNNRLISYNDTLRNIESDSRFLHELYNVILRIEGYIQTK